VVFAFLNFERCSVHDSLNLWVCRASLFGAFVGMTCEFQNGRRNRSKGNVLCFGKSQQGFTFSCSRLTDIGSMVCSNGQGLFVMDLGVKNIFDTKNTCLGAC
jgi:hypothetical protein